MFKTILILSIFTSSLTSIAQNISKDQSTTTYFFIRHAEKDLSDQSNRNPQLTETGIKRAQNWAKILADTKVELVFSTDYDRTRQTAQPIAEDQDVEVSLYDPNQLNTAEFQQKTKGKTSVIIGHSNTTPAFVNKIIGKEKYISTDEKVYGKLFIIKITGNTITDTVLHID